MHLFSRRGGATHFSLGDFNVVVAPTPVAEEVEKRVRRGDSLLVVGPHGVGKSIAVFSMAYKAVEEGAVVIDLASDTSTFAEYLRLAKKAKWAFAVFDALPPQFYSEPEIWSEHAALWRDSCGKILSRAEYVRRRGYPTVVVLSRELAVRCRSELSRFEKIAVRPDADVAEEIFLLNSEVYCGDDYAGEVVARIAKWGEGLGYMALYAAKSLQYCDEEPDGVVEKARQAYVEKLAALAKALYASTCPRARIFVNLMAYRHLPPLIASQTVHYDVVESKVRMLEKLLALIDKVGGPHREYVKILALQSAEELKRFMKPTWPLKALGLSRGALYEEALSKVAREVGEQCGAAPRQINLRTLVKAYVTAFEAYDDLAKSIVAVALGETPCIGKMRLLCRRGTLIDEVLDAILNPYRLSVELPPAAAEGLGQYAGKRAEDVDERGWIEVLNYLYDAAERGRRVDLRPFKDYVLQALSRGGQITKKLALALVESTSVVPGDVAAQALVTAADLGESIEGLLEKFVETVGDASLIYEKCGADCGDVVVEAAVASAARLAKHNPCLALRQLEVAVAGAGYGDVVNRYRPHETCKSI